MDNYLGSRGSSTNAVDIALIAVFALFLSACIKVMADYITSGKGAMDLFVGASFTGLLCWGLIAAVLRIVNRKKAKKIAEFLFIYPDSEISSEVITRELGIAQPSNTLLAMQRKKYLKNINYNMKTGIFSAVYKKVKPDMDMIRVVKCPNCSAECRLYLDRINRCEYCGSELIAGDNVDIDM